MRAAHALDPHLQRCPACGQPVEQPPPPHCSLCGFQFADDRVTHVDVTPYAQAYACRSPGWRSMSEWVWFAGVGRLNHLALMRASAASRRFALVYWLLLSAASGLFQTTRVGWRWVTGVSATPIKPTGEGWFAVARTRGAGGGDRLTDLWWNPAQSLIVMVTAGVGAMAGLALLLAMVRWGVRKAHASPYRGEQRMTAALHYSTAWSAPILFAALIIGFKPLAYVGGTLGWSWIPTARAFDYAAAVPAGVGLAMWWFGLVRLGATSPAKTRSRVVCFFVLIAPLMLGGVAAGWWFGLAHLFPLLFTAFDLTF